MAIESQSASSFIKGISLDGSYIQDSEMILYPFNSQWKARIYKWQDSTQQSNIARLLQ